MHALALLLHLLQGTLPARVEVVAVVQQGFQIAGDHRQWGAQLVTDVGDEVFAHLLQLVHAGDVAHQQQAIALAIQGDVKLQTQMRLARRGDF